MDQPTVLVTGASRGLGAAIARQAARLGARVVLLARSFDQVQAEAQAIQVAGGQALPLAGDVSRESDCQEAIDRTLERFGRLDALVNNAGLIEPIAPLAETNLKDWERNWAVNVLGPVILSHLALPHLRPQHGRIVNISSGAASSVIPAWGAYSTAKAALNHLTQVLAREEPDLTVIALAPGVVDTEMQATIREKGKSRMAEENYGRLYNLYQRGQLLPPDTPGLAIACLALYAPNAWSGQAMRWDDEPIQKLVQTHAPAPK